MSIRIHQTDLHVLNMRTRMPFRYGIVTMRAVPHLFVRVRVEVGGRSAWGLAADGLPPKWFTKDPERSFGDEIGDMLAVIRHATDTATGRAGESPFAIWLGIAASQETWARGRYPPLLSNLGVSLVERAVLDAYCRLKGEVFGVLLRQEGLGIDLGAVYEELAGCRAGDLLPAPVDRVIVRHTVGLTDPLRCDEVPDGERVDDGLPQALAGCIDSYGLTHLKIKLSGDPDRDVDRLRAIAGLLGERDYAFTLDGNENFRELGPFRDLWRTLCADPELRSFLGRLIFVEQPFHRDIALTPELGADLRSWRERPPLVIDESDGTIGDVPRALANGYVGSSHKNCKGIFKGIANGCLLAKRRREDPRGTYIQSGEDLCNVGPIALLQDLAVMASLGITHVERNGHHYIRGLSVYPTDLQEAVLANHGDLYTRHPAGFPTLAIRAGQTDLTSVLAAPFGVGIDLDPTRFTPVAEWDFASLEND